MNSVTVSQRGTATVLPGVTGAVKSLGVAILRSGVSNIVATSGATVTMGTTGIDGPMAAADMQTLERR